MKSKGSETCPACRGSMFPGDIVCLACERRVRAVRPNLLSRYANRDLQLADDTEEIRMMRVDIKLCAIQNLPTKGRPARRDRS